MLNKEILLANAQLVGLTEEQINAIVTLSQNDENAVIGARFGEVYRLMDSTIENATGIKRNGDEKTYNYLDRAVKQYAERYSDYDTIKASLDELKKNPEKSGDKVLKEQNENLKKELEATKAQLLSFKESADKEKENYARALFDYKLESEISRAKEGLKFKSGVNDVVMTTLVNQAVSNVKAKNPKFEDIDGKSVLRFHDENGVVLNNIENNLLPFTMKEMLEKEFKSMDLLEIKTKGGAGIVPSIKKQSGSMTATTKGEAIEEINKILCDKGISKTSLIFADEFDKLYNEYKVSNLPD